MMDLIGKGNGYTGAVWVAMRVPDGYVGGHANQVRVEGVKECMGSWRATPLTIGQGEESTGV